MESLIWRKTTETAIPYTTKAEIPFYNGSLVDYDEWYFRVRAKYDAYGGRDDEESLRRELAAKVLDGLGGEALRIAMDMGLDKVISPDGVLTMASAIRAAIAGKQFQKSKEVQTGLPKTKTKGVF